MKSNHAKGQLNVIVSNCVSHPFCVDGHLMWGSVCGDSSGGQNQDQVSCWTYDSGVGAVTPMLGLVDLAERGSATTPAVGELTQLPVIKVP